MRMMCRIVFFSLLIISINAWSADMGSLLRQSSLYEKPFNDAKIVTQLAAKTSVTITQRKSSWAQIQSGANKGWVKVFNIVSTTGSKSSADLATLGNVLKSGSSGQSASTGVKGISEESLKKAPPAPAEVTFFETLNANKGDAQAFASKGNLYSKSIPFLDKPED